MILSKHIHWNTQSKIRFSPEYIRLHAEQAIIQTPEFSNIFTHQKSNFLNSGTHGQRKSGSGTDFWQYREYREGDPAHNIDWRKSARSDTHYIRDREWEIAQTITIWLDNSASMQHVYNTKTLSKYQFAAILTYILSTKFIYAGERLSFLTPSIKSCTSKSALPDLAQSLALNNAEHVSAPLSGQPKSFPILISDFWDDTAAIDKQISNLTAGNYKGLIIHTVASEEINLPYKGRLKIQSLSHQDEGFTVNDITKAKITYKERVEQHCQNVAALADKHGCTYIRLTTDAPLTTATLDIHDMLTLKHGGAK
ncbi:MAG: DUF58 domain-containing protein [Alphaproteobacteria bacterium]|nr:DUF58 domain-containing protein [Alphaproteobacteria bacterium]